MYRSHNLLFDVVHAAIQLKALQLGLRDGERPLSHRFRSSGYLEFRHPQVYPPRPRFCDSRKALDACYSSPPHTDWCCEYQLFLGVGPAPQANSGTCCIPLDCQVARLKAYHNTKPVHTNRRQTSNAVSVVAEMCGSYVLPFESTISLTDQTLRLYFASGS